MSHAAGRVPRPRITSTRITLTISARSTLEHQPYRTVTEYWTLDGQKLVEHDPFIAEQARGGAR